MNESTGISTNGDNNKIALKSLSWDATIEELLFSSVLTQEYVNTDSKTLEIAYTFPLSWEAVVTEFAAEIEGKRLLATPLPKREAENNMRKQLKRAIFHCFFSARIKISAFTQLTLEI